VTTKSAEWWMQALRTYVKEDRQFRREVLPRILQLPHPSYGEKWGLIKRVLYDRPMTDEESDTYLHIRECSKCEPDHMEIFEKESYSLPRMSKS